MGASKTLITNLLEMRFDYMSSRNVLNNWRKHIHLKDDPDSYDDAQLRSLLEYLKENVPEAGQLHAAVERQILAKDAPAPVIEEHHEDAPAPVIEEHHEEAPAPVIEEHHEEAPANNENADAENAGDDNHDNENTGDDNHDNENGEGHKEGKKSRRKNKH